MTYNEAETRFWLIDPVLRGKGFDAHWKLKLETPAPVEPTGNKGRRRVGAGRTDYLLCVQAAGMPNPLPVGVIEAKAETADPLKGMQQAKGYADCTRFAVRYVFATNGYRYGEFNKVQQLPSGPHPFSDFPTHDALTARYAKEAARVLLSPATGAGKTVIAANLLWRLHEAGHLTKPALFLCDRDALRSQAYEKMFAVFGDNAAKNAKVLIATYQTLGLDDADDDYASFLTQHYPLNSFSIIIIDECHRSAWGRWSEVLLAALPRGRALHCLAGTRRGARHRTTAFTPLSPSL